MSAENTPAVALLFEDAEQSAHLREALNELGARIVHEGPATELDAAVLSGSGAQVVVINLDAAVEEHIDRIYDTVDLDRQRVVFNDAEASQGLSGWDQARWARHLAAKLMDQFDIDPPRPADARPVEVADVPAAVAERAADAATPVAGAAPGTSVPAEEDAASMPGTGGETESDDAAPGLDIDPADDSFMMRGEASVEAAEDDGALGAEFDALLAEGRDLLDEADEGDEADDFARIDHDDDVLAFDTGDLDTQDETSSSGDDAPPAASGTPAAADSEDGEPVAATALDEDDEAASVEAGDEGRAAASGIDWDAVEAVAPDAAPDEPAESTPSEAPAAPDWGLVDFNAGDDAGGDDANAVKFGHVDDEAEDFGIQKLSASEFLNPGDSGDASPIEPGLSLELVSLEDAVRPQMAEETPSSEMSLDMGPGLKRVIAIGATADSADVVHAFLQALPAPPDAALLLFQHAGDTDHEAHVAELAGIAGIRVLAAEHGGMARNGELLVVPPGQRLQLDRTGRVTLTAVETDRNTCDPSIDDGLSAAAMAFGEETFAVLLVSDANDAVAGAQVVHDRGGQVWLHHHGEEGASSMVAMLQREALVDQEDTPQMLAQRLIEATGAL